MKKEFNRTFFLNSNQAVDRIEVKTASLKGNPAFRVDALHEFFPGRFENVASVKTLVLSEDAGREAVRVAFDILKEADRIANNHEGAAFYESVARRMVEEGYYDLVALQAVIDEYNRL